MKARTRPSDVELLSDIRELGSVTCYAKRIGVPRSTVNDWWQEAQKREGTLGTTTAGGYDRTSYLITSAQIDTEAHAGFLLNLEKMAEVHGATILVPTYTYNKEGLLDSGSGKAEMKTSIAHFDKRIRKYIMNDRVKLNNNIEVIGTLNTLPTAVNPLSGYQTFTGSLSGVFPHPKVMSESVATSPDKMCKFLLTSGGCTLPNYKQKNAGIKAEFHHQIAAVLVEIVNDDKFHHRHVIAEADGSFYDLTDRYECGWHTTGHRVDSVNWGDIHYNQVDLDVLRASWFDKGNLKELLRPRVQFFHDLLDFQFRNHHNRDDHLWLSNMLTSSVKDEIDDALIFLEETMTDCCTSVVVSSNHDRALDRWVKEVDASDEPYLPNKHLLLQLQTSVCEYMLNEITITNMFAHYYNMFKDDMRLGLDNVRFLNPDESYKVNGVECGMHGDRGIGGARGSIKSYAKIGTKATIGHSHSSGIYEGVYQNGCSRTYPAEYSEGPCANSHTHTIQYDNGKRTQLTLIDGSYMKRVPYLAKL